MIDRSALKRDILALLDSKAAEHPLGHQANKAARYTLTTPAGATLELMFQKDEKSSANLWCLEKAATGASAPSNAKRSPASKLNVKRNSEGKILYGRHSALEHMPQLGSADLLCIPCETSNDAARLLDHLLTLTPADL